MVFILIQADKRGRSAGQSVFWSKFRGSWVVVKLCSDVDSEDCYLESWPTCFSSLIPTENFGVTLVVAEFPVWLFSHCAGRHIPTSGNGAGWRWHWLRQWHWLWKKCRWMSTRGRTTLETKDSWRQQSKGVYAQERGTELSTKFQGKRWTYFIKHGCTLDTACWWMEICANLVAGV